MSLLGAKIQNIFLAVIGVLVVIFYSGNSLRQSIYASSCPNRYLTLVNPIRSRDLWINKDLSSYDSQRKLVEQSGLSVTWLLTGDVLRDSKLLQAIKTPGKKQELGLFLEISRETATQARVVYPQPIDWANPRALFLSGYTLSDRRLLIDYLFENFYKTFGYFPKSVGAWWIDAFSLDYMNNKYGIKTALIVADQKTTDRYGVWGQWWGVPYVASKGNPLLPAKDKNDMGVTVIQWAQRDLSRAMGAGPSFSNYSLQANDYRERGLNINYFKQLSKIYLDCGLPVGQITVGLETGIEGYKFIDEYQRQLAFLSNTKNLESLTMADFGEKFRKLFENYPEEIELTDSKKSWYLSRTSRKNNFNNETIVYERQLVFADNYFSDKNDFLNRDLSDPNNFVYEKPKFSFKDYLISLEPTFLYLSRFRYTNIAGVKYFGFMIDNFRFVGITFPKIAMVNRDLDPVVAGSMLKIPFLSLTE